MLYGLRAFVSFQMLPALWRAIIPLGTEGSETGAEHRTLLSALFKPKGKNSHDESRSSFVCFHAAVVARVTEILVHSVSAWLPTSTGSPSDNIAAWHKHGQKGEIGTPQFNI